MSTEQLTPEIKVITSKQFLLDARDVLRGLLVAAITGGIDVIQSSFANGQFTFQWKSVGSYALYGGIAYIVKNWLTPSKTIVEMKPPVGPVEVANARTGDVVLSGPQPGTSAVPGATVTTTPKE